jgi:peptidoglycan-associated lipoprotein
MKNTLSLLRWATLLSLILMLAACTRPIRDAGEEAGDVGARGSAGLTPAEVAALGPREGMGAPLDQSLAVEPLEDPASLLIQRLVYFEYDQDVVRPEFIPLLQAHARYLSEHPGARLRLEGHTDERGTREYNLALGERRAQAVRRLMALNGAAERQMEPISYGEELPVAFTQSEESWRLNRRVELVYEIRR